MSTVAKIKEVSFCERMYAGPSSPWHIRPLTEAGKKLGGGADTKALCGAEVAWDLDVEPTVLNLKHCCRECKDIYMLGVAHNNKEDNS